MAKTTRNPSRSNASTNDGHKETPKETLDRAIGLLIASITSETAQHALESAAYRSARAKRAKEEFISIARAGGFDSIFERLDQGRSALGWALYFNLPEQAEALLLAGFPLACATNPNAHPSILPPSVDWFSHRQSSSFLNKPPFQPPSKEEACAWASCLVEMAVRGVDFQTETFESSTLPAFCDKDARFSWLVPLLQAAVAHGHAAVISNAMPGQNALPIDEPTSKHFPSC